jgi:hypothetical protein
MSSYQLNLVKICSNLVFSYINLIIYISKSKGVYFSKVKMPREFDKLFNTAGSEVYGLYVKINHDFINLSSIKIVRSEFK